MADHHGRRLGAARRRLPDLRPARPPVPGPLGRRCPSATRRPRRCASSSPTARSPAARSSRACGAPTRACTSSTASPSTPVTCRPTRCQHDGMVWFYYYRDQTITAGHVLPAPDHGRGRARRRSTPTWPSTARTTSPSPRGAGSCSPRTASAPPTCSARSRAARRTPSPATSSTSARRSPEFSEFTGPTFTADGKVLFVNMQDARHHPGHHRPVGEVPGLTDGSGRPRPLRFPGEGQSSSEPHSLDPAVADRLKRSADGLVPAVVQQHDTGEVLMLGWMDDEALARTLATGRATYWSRSRQEYWVKGETSGHVQWVKEVRLDCDGDTLLVKVDQEGPACHTGDRTCFDADVLSLRWPMPEPRRTFGPVVLLGLASGALSAVAGSRAWLEYSQRDSQVLDPADPGQRRRRDAAGDGAEPGAPCLLGCGAGDPRPGPPGRGGRWVCSAPSGWSQSSWPAGSSLPDQRPRRPRSVTGDLGDPSSPPGSGPRRSGPSSLSSRRRSRSAGCGTGPRWAAGTTRRAPRRRLQNRRRRTAQPRPVEGDGRGSRPHRVSC